MKSQKYTIQMIILIIFEVIVGIMWLIPPIYWFTREIFSIIFWYGAFLFYFARFPLAIFFLVFGIIKLNLYFHGKENTSNPLYAVFAIIGMLVGLTLVLFFDAIFEWIQDFGAFCGIIFVILGLYKLNSYFEARDKEQVVSKVNLLSGILAIIFGIVIVIYPDGIAILSEVHMIVITLTVEAVLDIMSIIQIVRKQKRIVNY